MGDYRRYQYDERVARYEAESYLKEGHTKGTAAGAGADRAWSPIQSSATHGAPLSASQRFRAVLAPTIPSSTSPCDD